MIVEMELGLLIFLTFVFGVLIGGIAVVLIRAMIGE